MPDGRAALSASRPLYVRELPDPLVRRPRDRYGCPEVAHYGSYRGLLVAQSDRACTMTVLPMASIPLPTPMIIDHEAGQASRQ
jgi:hypothetical protein